MSRIYPEKLEVEVTEEDIRIGKKSSAFHCPIALAVHRLNLHEINVSVTPFHFHIDDIMYFLPIQARNFVRFLDDSTDIELPKPFKFEAKKTDE